MSQWVVSEFEFGISGVTIFQPNYRNVLKNETETFWESKLVSFEWVKRSSRDADHVAI